MDSIPFALQSEYIELNTLLKLMGISGTGGQANMLIDAGTVLVNDQIETRRRYKVRKGDKIAVHQKVITVH